MVAEKPASAPPMEPSKPPAEVRRRPRSPSGSYRVMSRRRIGVDQSLVLAEKAAILDELMALLVADWTNLASARDQTLCTISGLPWRRASRPGLTDRELGDRVAELKADCAERIRRALTAFWSRG